LLELLDDTYGSLSSKQKKFIRNLIRQNEESIRFVYSLLDVSKIEAGKIEFEQQPVDLRSFFKDITSEFQNLAKFNHIKIIIDPFPKSLPTFYIDRETMSRIFKNIIENAIIYNRPGGKVQIQVKFKNNAADITISDTGIGISKKDLSKIGEKFFRTAVSRQHAAEGTGLGIFIAKKVIGLHKGSLKIQSVLNKGTTIKITLPIGNKENKTKTLKKMI